MRSLYRLLLALAVMTMCAQAFAQVVISVGFAPPALPVYEQPVCPAEGYMWVPGYWAYDPDYQDYYWVPGTWVLAPEPGLLWTPPYWGWNGTAFVFYDGYWGPQVGFYGGVVYGFGYFGTGYQGGHWQGNQFYYNRSVTNVNVTEIHNVYNTTVVNNTTTNVTRVSYNGGEGGTTARATPQEEAAAQARHVAPTAEQTQHVQAARNNPQLRASTNEGKPPIAATAKPAAFSGAGVVKAQQAGAPYHPPANRGTPAASKAPAADASKATHPNELPPLKPTNQGSSNDEQQLYQKQQNDRQQLQQQQEQEHQKLTQQNADEATKQQTEQKHQQQTQQLRQQQETEQRQLQERQGGGARPKQHPPEHP
jgi:WXXGXW repeat (2 copies)